MGLGVRDTGFIVIVVDVILTFITIVASGLFHDKN